MFIMAEIERDVSMKMRRTKLCARITLIAVTVLLCTGFASAETGGFLKGDASFNYLPEDTGAENSLLWHMNFEILQYSDIQVTASFNDAKNMVSYVSAAEHANELFGLDGNPDGKILIVGIWREEEMKNDAAVVVSDNLKDILTAEDIAAIENVLSAPTGKLESGLNGFKELVIRIFDAGDFEYPEYSFINEFVGNPGAEIVPDAFYLKSIVFDENLGEAQRYELQYLLGKFVQHTGIGLLLMNTNISPYDKADVTETAQALLAEIEALGQSGRDTFSSEYGLIAVAYDIENSKVGVVPQEALASSFTEADISKIQDAFFSETLESEYDILLAGLKTLMGTVISKGDYDIPENSPLRSLWSGTDGLNTSTVIIMISAAVIIVGGILLFVRKKKK